MKTAIKTTHVELTPELRAYIEKRTAALDKFIDVNDTTALCEVEVGRTTEHHQKGNVFRAEIQVSTRGNLFRAEAERETLNEAIDTAKSEAARELRRHKNKNTDLFRRGGAAIKKMLRRS